MDIEEILDMLQHAQLAFTQALEKNNLEKLDLKHAMEEVYRKNVEMNKVIKEYQTKYGNK